jgi:hypothetical protein
MSSIGHPPEALHVEIAEYEGPVKDAAGLKDELTEAMWRSGDSMSVSMRSAPGGPNLLVLMGNNYVAPLIVAYHGGTIQERETLRTMVERRLPRPGVSPVRRWRLFGPLMGLAWVGTWLLVGTRISPIVHVHISHGLQVALFVITQAVGVAWFALLTRTALVYWFPVLERLPDSGRTRWDAARSWVIFGASTWLAIVLALLTLPESNPY